MSQYPPITTNNQGEHRRLKVDVGHTGFYQGREFRTFYEFNIAAGQSTYLRFVSPIDFIVFQQNLEVDDGSIRMSISSGGTPAGSFNVQLPIIGRNRMSERPLPLYEPVITVQSGGTHSGGTELDVMRLVAANATSQRTSIGASISDERGLPAGTFYLRFQNFGTGAATGVYSLYWEERQS